MEEGGTEADWGACEVQTKLTFQCMNGWGEGRASADLPTHAPLTGATVAMPTAVSNYRSSQDA